jgi:hypothetical protein
MQFASAFPTSITATNVRAPLFQGQNLFESVNERAFYGYEQRCFDSARDFLEGKRKYADTFDEFTACIAFYLRNHAFIHGRTARADNLSRLYNFICDNQHYLHIQTYYTSKAVQDKFVATIRNKLIEFMTKNKWTGAKIYLDRLFPHSAGKYDYAYPGVSGVSGNLGDSGNSQNPIEIE